MNKTKLRGIAAKLGATNFSACRDFLAAVYADAKAQDATYSYARLSTDLGLGSSNAHSVISGIRPLGERAAEKIASALQLTGTDRRYFIALVRQDRAKNPGAREAAFQERLALKRRALPTELSRRQLEFFERWYHAAILELLRLDDSMDDPQWISATLRPAVPPAEIEESLKLLVELGYLARDKRRARLYPTEAKITTGDEAYGLAIASYHRQMIDLAVEALDRCAPEERDIGAVTIAVPRASYGLIKDELSSFRKRLLKLADESQNADNIVQINLQMFPLMSAERKKK